MCDTCNRSDLVAVAKSNLIVVSRCGRCGRYWLHEDGDWLRPANEAEQALAEIVAALVRLKLPAAAGRALAALLAAVVVTFTGFHDWNGNWAFDGGESLAAGQFRIYRTAADGAVSMFDVATPVGHWYRLEVEEGDRIEVESRCGGRITIVAGSEWYVPVICRAVLLPLALGG